ncbi:hypothetical protein PAAG_11719 [Paracoccidioides lutzii Pb01]|uniref:Uncharacterized protein n=1 Tax=Paracoccidioides lutzii (strain ATCC MYA-826 / Pb01) TaxID=502779 RepID=A0A0A2V1C0_PARBA|nr:hypothetical protein PAAG_11719 [Paracoccidioides lutzii Pb01]KGQ01591.1 hypothetical protein PAAG_11719 [Paracoccidioides lutzii Pb01]
MVQSIPQVSSAADSATTSGKTSSKIGVGHLQNSWDGPSKDKNDGLCNDLSAKAIHADFSKALNYLPNCRH